MDRFLIDGYKPQRLSTYALSLFRHRTSVGREKILIGEYTRERSVSLSDNYFLTSDFWDTAGQECFQSMHPSYYHQAHACILVFDATRKNTYKSLPKWYKEMRQYRPNIPCVCGVNKIDGARVIACRTQISDVNFCFFLRKFRRHEEELRLLRQTRPAPALRVSLRRNKRGQGK